MIVLTSFKIKYCFILTLCLLFLGVMSVFSQVSFVKFPKDNQVLQRNDQNKSNVNIVGRVNDSNHSSVRLVILKDNISFFQQTISLALSKDFSFEAPIIAGNFDYTIQFFLDNQEMKKAEKVACGDVFLIYGQSNAMGGHGIANYWPPRNPFIRSFVTFDYENPTGEWVLPYTTFFWPSAGALELSNFLSEKHKYPIGIIEASAGGAGISELNANPNNPFDRNTPFGKMLISADINNLRTDLKYLIFRHGETDGSYSNMSLAYPAEFEKLYNSLSIHFPNLISLYNLQVDILTESNPNAGFLRDFQRRTKSLYRKVSTMATIGTVGHDGLHYSFAGYKQTALELSRILGKEIYNDNQSPQIYSPDIKKIYFENQKLVLEFDEGTEMIYPQDSVASGKSWSMKDYIYVDGKNDVVQSGEAQGNKVYLTVSDIQNAKKVSYLPNSYGQFGASFYNGVYLKNKFGMRAFSFDDISIGGNTPVIIPPPVTINLNTEVNEDIQVKLIWNGNAQTKYHIERSNDNINFGEIGQIAGDIFFDTQTQLGKTYFYRVFVENVPNNKSNTKEVILKCLENVNLKILPLVAYIGANTSITAIVSITETKPLSLTANKSIDLNPGFDAKLGSDFSAEIGGCKNN
jgi:hypothetical protein